MPGYLGGLLQEICIYSGGLACSKARRQEPECRDRREPVVGFPLRHTWVLILRRSTVADAVIQTALRLLPASLTTSRAGCYSFKRAL